MAAPEFTLFVAPYVEGYQDGEEGNTPITAEILNENYDAFLLALNEWATSVGLAIDGIPTKTSDLNNDSNFVADASYVHTDNNYTTTEKNKLSGIEANANNYSLPTASASTLGGVKIDGITITIDANGVISSQGGGTDVEGNPSGTPTAVLSSIRIGSTVYSIPGGGGGGSSVSFTQVLSTGTKIGTITIDGVPTDIYAPTPPTKTSDLTNDSNFVADANYVHTDNNYTTNEKNKLSGLVAVEANPSGSASTDLTKIAINGTNYNIPSGGGGGTTVVANPSGAATAGDLNKLQVGNDIYSIPSGGSGGGSGFTKTTLYELSGNNPESVISLSESIENFDLIEVVALYGYSDNEDYKQNAIFNSQELCDSINTQRPKNWFVGNDSVYVWFYVTDVDELTIHTVSGMSGLGIWYVYGYRFNGGSGGGGGTGSGKTLVKKTKTYTGDGQIPLVVTFDEKPLLVYSIYGPGLNESNTVRMYPFVYGETKASGRYINNDSSSGNIGYTIAYSNNDLTMSVTSNPGDAGACLNNNGSSFTITYLVEENTSSGHTILNDSGTELAQEDNLQFKGAYAHDDSTNGATVVEVTRVMTSEEYALLTDAEKKGVIVIEDEPDPSSSGFTDYEGTLTAGQTSLTINGLEIDNTKLFDYYTDILGVNPTNAVVTNGQIVLTFPAQQTDLHVIVSVRSKTHVDKPFDIDLSDFITDKIWKYYDSANWSDATSDGSKITIAGGEERSDWTTATWVCIDLTQYPVPNNLSKLKIHLPSIETLGYSGLCVVTDSDKFGPGSNGGSDTMLRKSRLEISSGVYVLGDPSLGLNETDYTLEIPCTKNDLSRYLYIGATDGVNPSDSNTYNNSLNGSFDVEIDGLWYE